MSEKGRQRQKQEKAVEKKSMCEFGFGDRAKVFLPLLEENGNKDKRTTTDDL